MCLHKRHIEPARRLVLSCRSALHSAGSPSSLIHVRRRNGYRNRRRTPPRLTKDFAYAMVCHLRMNGVVLLTYRTIPTIMEHVGAAPAPDPAWRPLVLIETCIAA